MLSESFGVHVITDLNPSSSPSFFFSCPAVYFDSSLYGWNKNSCTRFLQFLTAADTVNKQGMSSWAMKPSLVFCMRASQRSFWSNRHPLIDSVVNSTFWYRMLVCFLFLKLDTAFLNQLKLS